MRLGKAGVTGDGPGEFNRPSDVLVAPNSDIFVVDGHGSDGNNRVQKFSKDGKFIKMWGKTGTGPGEFLDPHALEMEFGPKGGFSSATGRTIASRSSIRTGTTSRAGRRPVPKLGPFEIDHKSAA